MRDLLGPDIRKLGSSEINAIFDEYYRQFPPYEATQFPKMLAKRTYYARQWALFLEDYPLVLTPFLLKPFFSPGRNAEGAEGAEGVRVGEGAVLSMGVYLGASTKIIDRATGEIHRGEVPPYAVVVPGSLPGKPLPDGTPGPSLYCAVIVKTVDAQTRSKTGINELLRD